MAPTKALNALQETALKFSDPQWTADGSARATVALKGLSTLWFNTGTLCNLTCRNCYIESSPKNDALVYLTVGDVKPYLAEVERNRLPVKEIGFTGGEPFMAPEFIDILELTLRMGFQVLVLTNAMRPMMKRARDLIALNNQYPGQLTMRVSLDHYTPAHHEEERGPRTWAPSIAGLDWLAENGFNLHVAGRTCWGESETDARAGFQRLFSAHGWPINAENPAELVLFPEMDLNADVPEITTACWGILDKDPGDIMCATSRMIVRRKGAEKPAVIACTLLPYDPQFELGPTLKDASKDVSLNHPFCATFCVLGGASCSAD